MLLAILCLGGLFTLGLWGFGCLLEAGDCPSVFCFVICCSFMLGWCFEWFAHRGGYLLG